MDGLDGIGAFRWWPAADRWWWNDALVRLCGHEPGAVTPGRPLLLAHTHPRDRERVGEALADLALHRRPFCTRLRLVTAAGDLREVVGAAAVGEDGEDGEDGEGPVLRGYVIPLDVDLGAPPLDGPALPGPVEVAIPVPRGREGTGPAAPVDAGEAAGEAAVPEGRAGEAAGVHHAELMRRAHDVLVAALDVGREGAAGLVAWLANAREVPPVIVAEELVAVRRDGAGRPDLAALLALLDDGSAGGD